MSFTGLFFLGVGVFVLVAAAINWDWFFEHRKSQLFVSLFGRTGARVFYALLGAGISAYGAGSLLGMILLE